MASYDSSLLYMIVPKYDSKPLHMETKILGVTSVVATWLTKF